MELIFHLSYNTRPMSQSKFDLLLEVARRLNGPNGCPWDLKQTFESLQPYILEEAHEVLEALDLGDEEKIIEELGDLLYTVIFYAKVAEKQNLFTIDDILEAIRLKLIRRHPHVFGEIEAKNADEVIKRWEEIKKTEKGHSDRKSALDGIPKNLPLTLKAQKILRKVKQAGYRDEKQHSETIGDRFLSLCAEAEEKGIDVEIAFRQSLAALEKKFRAWEEKG